MKRNNILKMFLSFCVVLFAMFSLCACVAGEDGKSAYEIAVANGFVGTEAEWLESLRGEDGSSVGQGKSAYEIAVDNGFVGTEAEWLASLNTYEDAFEVAMNKCLTSVVMLKVDSSSGSGVIVDYNDKTTDAYIITNFHVVYDNSKGAVSSSIKLYLYGTDFKNSKKAISAQYKGGSVESDIAVLHAYISADLYAQKRFSVAKIGSSSRLVVGQRVGAIGNAKSKGISLTSGVVGVDNEDCTFTRVDNGNDATVRAIRYDAYIASGNSGGGLFNAKGELIGITNAKTKGGSNSGDYYEFYNAIPINLVYGVYQNVMKASSGLLDEVTASRVALNVTVTSADKYATVDSETDRVYIKEKVVVQDVGASMSAYFNVGDEILSITYNGKEKIIDRTFDVSDLMWQVKVGETLTFKIKRNGQVKTVTLTAVKNLNTTNPLEF